MKRAFFALLTAITFAATLAGGHALPASAAAAPGRITLLAATCPSSSSMYQRVVAGQDPSSGENGNAADPADIAAYGCSPVSGLGFFLLANSTARSVFTDQALTNAATVSSTESGAAGATILPAGSTVYVPGGVAQTRRFSVWNYPTTITARAAMPFLDLQCLTDGYNNDNADGAGWSDQAIVAGAQTYCIAYVWDGVVPPTATPTTAATATPTATRTAAATTTATTTATATATTTATATPTSTSTAPPTATTTPATVKKSFVKAEGGVVTWRLEPSSPANMVVRDVNAASCEGFAGAACGNIAAGGTGTFSSAGGNDQHLLVTQPYKQDGESCSVKNTAEWSTDPTASTPHQSVDASYICSGAPTMGWRLFGLFAAGLLAMTWVARRKLQWPE